jgi:peptide/nickel transport system permease protein
VRGIVALILFQTLLFGLINSLPTNFATVSRALAGPQARQFMERRLGLDQPFYIQYFNWISRALQFDLGESYFYREEVSQVLLARTPRTVLLFMSAAIIAFIFGIWMGKVVAWQKNKPLEVGLILGGVATQTSFAPWLAFVVLNIFGWYLGWFPYTRMIDHNVWLNAPISLDNLLLRMVVTLACLAVGVFLVFYFSSRLRDKWLRTWIRITGTVIIAGIAWLIWSVSGLKHLAGDVLLHMALPFGTLVLLAFGESMMLMRATMLETVHEDHVITARAKGLPDGEIRDRHVARNAILPVLTQIILTLPFVLIGSLIIERVFFWRAMGEVLFNAIEFFDLPLIVGLLSVVAVITVFAHVGLDILYVYLDPRLRFAEES